MKRKQSYLEAVVHGIFLLLGLVTVACVLLITVYLVVSGIPAIREIGIVKFLFGAEWASTAAEPKYGILPFILTSVYGTAGAILLGVPIGFLTAVYLAKMAPKSVKEIMGQAVSMLAGIPSVVYGLVGMMALVPGIRKLFHVPDGASLLAAIVVLAIMILPSIIKMSVTALEAVPKEYEDASLALGATPEETWFRVSVPAAKSGIAAAVVLGVGRAIGEAMAVMMVAGNAANMPSLFQSVRFLTTAVASEMSYSSGLQRQALFSMRTSAHAGVAIRISLHSRMMKLSRRRTDCHTSDIGHWFAMTHFSQCAYTDVKLDAVFRCRSPLDLSFLFQIQDSLRQRTELFYEKRFPQRSVQFRPGCPVIPQIREGDKLLSYPCESMKPFLDFLQEAVSDPNVVSIKMTLYRVARHSKIIESLIEAAENGKSVLALVELKACFNEENNIEWSRRLEEAGCQVIYGLDGFKVHSKLCLVTRRENGKTEYFTQIGTGNYNEKTSRLYTDLSLMTADTAIGLEAAAVFQALAKGEAVEASQQLLVAPKCLQNRILDMIDEEINAARQGLPAYIGVKINSLTDKVIIDRLIAASQAGVKIDLIVRGICCLLPGVPGATENIRVISIVGRFLEHSRIYIFGTQERQRVYIASADFMTRNTLRRVEVAAPILDAQLRRRLTEMFQTMLRDNRQARELQAQRRIYAGA